MRQTRQFVLLYILFLFSWLTLGINTVYAQEPTPSATWQPLFPSPTARPTINDTCPDYQPIGWLTVTPSSRWLMNCSQCIIQETADWSNIYTPTPASEKIHDGRCTEEEQAEDCYYHFDLIDLELNGCYCPLEINATVTPSPTINTTPTQQTAEIFIKEAVDVVRFDSPGGITDMYVNGSSLTFNYAYTNSDCGENNYTLGVFSKITHSVTNNQAGISLYEQSFNGTLNLKEMNYIGGVYSNDIDYLCKIPNAIQQVLGTEFEASWLCSQGLNYYGGSLYWYANNRPLTHFFQLFPVGGPTWAFNGQYEISLICYGVEPQAATATPTPGASDYCNEVEERPEYIADEIGLQLPIPRFGEGSCIVVGGWVIDISWLQSIFPNLFTFGMPESLGVPGFNLCLHPFTFGYMNLFGILLDMDVMFLLVSYIMVVRWLLRS